MSQAAKWPYKAVSTTSRNALGMSETSTSTKWTHHVEIGHQEVTWATKRSRRMSRAVRTAQRLSEAPDTMGDDPRASGTSVMSKRTRYVEEMGREAIRMRKSSQEISAVNRSAEAMETALRWTG